MNLSLLLQQHIEQALTELQQPPHQLAPFRRLEIYQAIGPVDDEAADHIRGWLHLITGQYVLPMWEELIPSLTPIAKEHHYFFISSEIPRHALDTIEAILRGTLPRIDYIPHVEDEDPFNIMYEWLESIGTYRWFPTRAWWVLRAIYRASPILLSDTSGEFRWPGFPGAARRILPIDTDVTLTDQYLDPPAFAARAQAISALGRIGDRTIHSAGYNPNSLREFWEWWLTIAIPEAHRRNGLETVLRDG